MYDASATTQLNFNIPKIKKKVSKDNLRNVSITSRDAVDILQVIDQSYLDHTYKGQWEVTSVQIVDNPELESSYRKKRQELKEDGRHTRELSEQFCFLTFRSDRQVVSKVIKNGLKTRPLNISPLGDGKSGVYICRHPDVQLRVADGRDEAKTCICVFKVTLGRCKAMPVASQDCKVEPTPNFDSHISAIPAQPSDTPTTQILRSQIYLFEYTDEALPSDRPRHCLPYALVDLKKNLSGLKSTSRPRSSYDRFGESWRTEAEVTSLPTWSSRVARKSVSADGNQRADSEVTAGVDMRRMSSETPRRENSDEQNIVTGLPIPYPHFIFPRPPIPGMPMTAGVMPPVWRDTAHIPARRGIITSQQIQELSRIPAEGDSNLETEARILSPEIQTMIRTVNVLWSKAVEHSQKQQQQQQTFTETGFNSGLVVSDAYASHSNISLGQRADSQTSGVQEPKLKEKIPDVPGLSSEADIKDLNESIEALSENKQSALCALDKQVTAKTEESVRDRTDSSNTENLDPSPPQSVRPGKKKISLKDYSSRISVAKKTQETSSKTDPVKDSSVTETQTDTESTVHAECAGPDKTFESCLYTPHVAEIPHVIASYSTSSLVKNEGIASYTTSPVKEDPDAVRDIISGKSNIGLLRSDYQSVRKAGYSGYSSPSTVSQVVYSSPVSSYTYSPHTQTGLSQSSHLQNQQGTKIVSDSGQENIINPPQSGAPDIYRTTEFAENTTTPLPQQQQQQQQQLPPVSVQDLLSKLQAMGNIQDILQKYKFPIASSVSSSHIQKSPVKSDLDVDMRMQREAAFQHSDSDTQRMDVGIDHRSKQWTTYHMGYEEAAGDAELASYSVSPEAGDEDDDDQTGWRALVRHDKHQQQRHSNQTSPRRPQKAPSPRSSSSSSSSMWSKYEQSVNVYGDVDMRCMWKQNTHRVDDTGSRSRRSFSPRSSRSEASIHDSYTRAETSPRKSFSDGRLIVTEHDDDNQSYKAESTERKLEMGDMSPDLGMWLGPKTVVQGGQLSKEADYTPRKLLAESTHVKGRNLTAEFEELGRQSEDISTNCNLQTDKSKSEGCVEDTREVNVKSCISAELRNVSLPLLEKKEEQSGGVSGAVAALAALWSSQEVSKTGQTQPRSAEDSTVPERENSRTNREQEVEAGGDVWITEQQKSTSEATNSMPEPPADSKPFSRIPVVIETSVKENVDIASEYSSHELKMVDDSQTSSSIRESTMFGDSQCFTNTTEFRMISENQSSDGVKEKKKMDEDQSCSVTSMISHCEEAGVKQSGDTKESCVVHEAECSSDINSPSVTDETKSSAEDLRITEETQSSIEEEKITQDTQSSVEQAKIIEDTQSFIEEEKITEDTQSSIEEAKITEDTQSSIEEAKITEDTQSSIEEAKITEDTQSSIEEAQVTEDTQSSIEEAKITEDTQSSIEEAQVTEEIQSSIEEAKITAETRSSSDVKQYEMNLETQSSTDFKINDEMQSYTEIKVSIITEENEFNADVKHLMFDENQSCDNITECEITDENDSSNDFKQSLVIEENDSSNDFKQNKMIDENDSSNDFIQSLVIDENDSSNHFNQNKMIDGNDSSNDFKQSLVIDENDSSNHFKQNKVIDENDSSHEFKQNKVIDESDSKDDTKLYKVGENSKEYKINYESQSSGVNDDSKRKGENQSESVSSTDVENKEHRRTSYLSGSHVKSDYFQSQWSHFANDDFEMEIDYTDFSFDMPHQFQETIPDGTDSPDIRSQQNTPVQDEKVVESDTQSMRSSTPLIDEKPLDDTAAGDIGNLTSPADVSHAPLNVISQSNLAFSSHLFLKDKSETSSSKHFTPIERPFMMDRGDTICVSGLAESSGRFNEHNQSGRLVIPEAADKSDESDHPSRQGTPVQDEPYLTGYSDQIVTYTAHEERGAVSVLHKTCLSSLAAVKVRDKTAKPVTKRRSSAQRLQSVTGITKTRKSSHNLKRLEKVNKNWPKVCLVDFVTALDKMSDCKMCHAAVSGTQMTKRVTTRPVKKSRKVNKATEQSRKGSKKSKQKRTHLSQKIVESTFKLCSGETQYKQGFDDSISKQNFGDTQSIPGADDNISKQSFGDTQSNKDLGHNISKQGFGDTQSKPFFDDNIFKQDISDNQIKSDIDDNISKQSFGDTQSKKGLDDSISKQSFGDAQSKQCLDDSISKQSLDDTRSKSYFVGSIFKESFGDSQSKSWFDSNISHITNNSISKQSFVETQSIPGLDDSISEQSSGNTQSIPGLDNMLSKQSFDDTQPKQALDESISKQSFGNTQSIPGLDNMLSEQSFGDAQPEKGFDDSISKQSFGDTQSEQGLDDSISKPSFGDTQYEQGLDDSISKQSFGDTQSKLGFGDSISKQSFDVTQSIPGLDDSIFKQNFGNTQSIPGLDDSISKQSFDDTQIKSSFDDIISKLSFGDTQSKSWFNKQSFDDNRSLPGLDDSISKQSFGDTQSKSSFDESISKQSFCVTQSIPGLDDSISKQSFDDTQFKSSFDESISKQSFGDTQTIPGLGDSISKQSFGDAQFKASVDDIISKLSFNDTQSKSWFDNISEQSFGDTQSKQDFDDGVSNLYLSDMQPKLGLAKIQSKSDSADIQPKQDLVDVQSTLDIRTHYSKNIEYLFSLTQEKEKKKVNDEIKNALGKENSQVEIVYPSQKEKVIVKKELAVQLGDVYSLEQENKRYRKEVAVENNVMKNESEEHSKENVVKKEVTNDIKDICLVKKEKEPTEKEIAGNVIYSVKTDDMSCKSPEVSVRSYVKSKSLSDVSVKEQGKLSETEKKVPGLKTEDTDDIDIIGTHTQVQFPTTVEKKKLLIKFKKTETKKSEEDVEKIQNISTLGQKYSLNKSNDEMVKDEDTKQETDISCIADIKEKHKTETSESQSFSTEESLQTSVSSENHQKTSVSSESHQKTSVCTESHQKTSVSTESHQKTNVSTESHQKTSVCTESHQKTSVSTESHQKTSVSTESHQKTSVCTESHQKTSVSTESDQTSGHSIPVLGATTTPYQKSDKAAATTNASTWNTPVYQQQSAYSHSSGLHFMGLPRAPSSGGTGLLQTPSYLPTQHFPPVQPCHLQSNSFLTRHVSSRMTSSVKIPGSSASVGGFRPLCGPRIPGQFPNIMPHRSQLHLVIPQMMPRNPGVSYSPVRNFLPYPHIPSSVNLSQQSPPPAYSGHSRLFQSTMPPVYYRPPGVGVHPQVNRPIQPSHYYGSIPHANQPLMTSSKSSDLTEWFADIVAPKREHSKSPVVSESEECAMPSDSRKRDTTTDCTTDSPLPKRKRPVVANLKQIPLDGSGVDGGTSSADSSQKNSNPFLVFPSRDASLGDTVCAGNDRKTSDSPDGERGASIAPSCKKHKLEDSDDKEISKIQKNNEKCERFGMEEETILKSNQQSTPDPSSRNISLCSKDTSNDLNSSEKYSLKKENAVACKVENPSPTKHLGFHTGGSAASNKSKVHVSQDTLSQVTIDDLSVKRTTILNALNELPACASGDSQKEKKPFNVKCMLSFKDLYDPSDPTADSSEEGELKSDDSHDGENQKEESKKKDFKALRKRPFGSFGSISRHSEMMQTKRIAKDWCKVLPPRKSHILKPSRRMVDCHDQLNVNFCKRCPENKWRPIPPADFRNQKPHRRMSRMETVIVKTHCLQIEEAKLQPVNCSGGVDKTETQREDFKTTSLQERKSDSRMTESRSSESISHGKRSPSVKYASDRTRMTLEQYMKDKLNIADPSKLQKRLPWSLKLDINSQPRNRRKRIIHKAKIVASLCSVEKKKNRIDESSVAESSQDKTSAKSVDEVKLEDFTKDKIVLELQLVQECLKNCSEKRVEKTDDCQNSLSNSDSSFDKKPQSLYSTRDGTSSDSQSINKECSGNRTESLADLAIIREALSEVEHDLLDALRPQVYIGRSHQKVPREILFPSETSKIYTDEGCFLLLLVPISKKPYQRLFDMKVSLQKMYRDKLLCASQNNTGRLLSLNKEIKSLQLQRKTLMTTFTGSLGKKRLRRLNLIKKRYDTCLNYLVRTYGRECLNRMMYVQTLHKAIVNHVKIVEKELVSPSIGK